MGERWNAGPTTNTPSTFCLDGNLFSTAPVEVKLARLHKKLRDEGGFPSLGRISIATYDADTDLLAVRAYSDGADTPLHLYSAPLGEVPSLAALAKSGQARIVRDMFALRASSSPHSAAVRQNYRSSLTIPIRKGAAFFGFIFFNSDQVDFFTPEVAERLLPYGSLLAAITVADRDRFDMLQAAVQTTRDIGNLRDDETAGHLHRMAAFTRLIALGLARKYDLSESWIDMLTHFAPLHDVGKIGVPDSILFKPGKLDPDELDIMRSHVDIGMHIVDTLLANFAISEPLFKSMLINIVACHHEAVDGSGYPKGLIGSAIPLEARIVSVADIFDALVSKRTYKEAWTNGEAFAYLRAAAGARLDADCVAALIYNTGRVIEIQERFRNGSELVEDRPIHMPNAPVLTLS